VTFSESAIEIILNLLKISANIKKRNGLKRKPKPELVPQRFFIKKINNER